jgi:hypothetical protein
MKDEEAVRACPRCGGRFQTLRRFSRWGRTVLVLLCDSCRYTSYEASPQTAG